MKYYGKEMETEHPVDCLVMTWKDAEEMNKLNYACGWSFSDADLLRLTANHMDAYYDGEETTVQEEIDRCIRTMEMIEWRLTDANFHMFCALLHNHKYSEATKEISDAIARKEY